MGEAVRLLSAILRPTVHLERALLPLGDWLRSPDVVEIVLNRPGEVWVERLGPACDGAPPRAIHGRGRDPVPCRARRRLHRPERFGGDAPALGRAAVGRALPGRPAAGRVAGGAFAIRKQVVKDLALDDFERMGAFADTVVTDETTS